MMGVRGRVVLKGVKVNDGGGEEEREVKKLDAVGLAGSAVGRASASALLPSLGYESTKTAARNLAGSSARSKQAELARLTRS